MGKVCVEAEAAMFHRVMFDDLRHLTPRPTVTVQTAAIAAVNASFQQDAAAIMTLTTTGRYARQEVYICDFIFGELPVITSSSLETDFLIQEVYLHNHGQ